MPQNLKILGIDPSLTNCGWGIIETESNHIHYSDSGTIKTNVKKKLADRVKFIHESLQKVIDKYQPDICSIEEIFVNKNPLSSLKLAHARGAIMLSISLSSIPIYEYSPNQIKKSVSGNGHADKTQISYIIKQILPKNQAKTEHEFDALAIALCHSFINTSKIPQ